MIQKNFTMEKYFEVDKQSVQNLSRCDGLEARQTSKPQNRGLLFDVELYLTVFHRSQILCFNFTKYYSSWLLISAIAILDDYF
jgi:hypothetical protein